MKNNENHETSPDKTKSRAFKRIQDHFPKPKTKNYINIVDFEMIDKSFKQENVLLLAGIPGAGKSTLAIEYAKAFSTKVNDAVVVWINSDDQSKIDETFRRILINDLKEEEDKYKQMSNDERIKAITKHIVEIRNAHLFVFDNIEEEQIGTVEMICESMPVLSNLKMILTSRNKQINKNSELKMNVIELGGLLPDQIKQYYDERIISGVRLSKAKADLIFKQVLLHRGQLSPYYLDKVVGTLELYIEDNGLDEDEIKELVDILKSVDITDRMLCMLQSRPECKALLEVLSFLNQGEISVRLLDKLCSNKANNKKALAVLEKYSLAIPLMMNDLKYIRMHRLTTEALTRVLKADMQVFKKSKKAMMHKFAELSQDVISEKNEKKKDEKIALIYYHLCCIHSMEPEDLEDINFVDNLVKIDCKRLGYGKKAVEDQRTKIDQLKKFYQQVENQDIADNLATLCELIRNSVFIEYYDLGSRCSETEKIVRSVYAGHEDKLNYARDLHLISLGYSMVKNHEKALLLINESEQVYAKLFDSNPVSLEYPKMCLDKVNVLIQLNKTEEAVASCKKAVHYLSDYHQKNQQDIEYALHLKSFTTPLIKMEEFALTTQICTVLEEFYRKYFSINSNNKALASELKSLGDVYKSMHKSEEAKKFFYEASRLYTEYYTMNSSDDDFYQDYLELAYSLRDLNDDNKALEAFKQVTKFLKSNYNENQDDLKFSKRLISMAQEVQDLEQHDLASQYYKEAVDALRRYHTENPNDMNFVDSLNLVAQELKKLKKNKPATELFKEAAQFHRNFYQANRFAQLFAVSMKFIADSLRQMEEIDDAFEIYNESADAVLKHFQEHPKEFKCAQDLVSIAHAMITMKKTSRAYDFLEMAEDIYGKSYQETWSEKDYGINLLKLANEVKLVNKPEKALELYKLSAQHILKYYIENPNDRTFFWNLKLIADELKKLEKTDEATAHYKEAIRIYRKLNKDHPDDQKIAMNLSILAGRLRDVLQTDDKSYDLRDSSHLEEFFVKFIDNQ